LRNATTELARLSSHVAKVPRNPHTATILRYDRRAPRAGVASDGSRRVRTVGRNDPCPCGSGQKFKRCHGSA
jgi:uncharacterized protein YecA (UPF0149 family)